MNIKNFVQPSSLILVSMLLLGLTDCAMHKPLPGPVMRNGQLAFASPEQAVPVLETAVKEANKQELVKIFGGSVKDILNSGDDVADAQGLKNVAEAMAEHVEIKPLNVPDESRKVAMLVLGKENWPFPIALVNDVGAWRFDTANGKQEILNRRIGNNELGVLNLCREYVAAQHEFSKLKEANGGSAEYAQKFLSAPQMRDGLYWPPKEGEPESPFGPLVAAAASEGYTKTSKGEGPKPYHGYYFRILKSQGKNAPGGPMNYLVKGKMSRGFAMLAYPAQWGSSGIMSFLVGQDGAVYQKNLGAKTQMLAAAINSFDPDVSWAHAED